MFTSSNEHDIGDGNFPASCILSKEIGSVGDAAHLKCSGSSRDSNWAILTEQIIYVSLRISDASCTFEVNNIAHAWHT